MECFGAIALWAAYGIGRATYACRPQCRLPIPGHKVAGAQLLPTSIVSVRTLPIGAAIGAQQLQRASVIDSRLAKVAGAVTAQ